MGVGLTDAAVVRVHRRRGTCFHTQQGGKTSRNARRVFKKKGNFFFLRKVKMGFVAVGEDWV